LLGTCFSISGEPSSAMYKMKLDKSQDCILKMLKYKNVCYIKILELYSSPLVMKGKFFNVKISLAGYNM
jgi:hypothetical protein